jgi:hypothetical protein
VAYFNSYSDRPRFAGCGGGCACGGRCPRRKLGENYVRDEDEPGTTAGGFGEAVAMRDVARLTDIEFHRRHPELGGRRIRAGETRLAEEWRMIRDRVVRPALARGALPPVRAPSPRTPPQMAPQPTVATSGPCPKEDPFPDPRHKLGAPCGPDGRKCWPLQASLDILDPDMLCNGEDRRSSAAYSAVLDYFNVAHPNNHRYKPGGGKTYCNIYVHDVTRAMRASIPHWIRDPSQKDHPAGWNELSANGTFDWLQKNGAAAGWIRIHDIMIEWLNQQFNRRQSIPFPGNALPAGLMLAGGTVAAASHADPTLLRDDGYVAQQFANLGLPTVIAWFNPRRNCGEQKNRQCSGHVAMVRPETTSLRGELRAVGHGRVFVPRSAQAGRTNWDNALATWIVKARDRQFWVHA